MKGTKLFAGLFLVALTMVLFATSCSKSTTNPNAPYIGTFIGTIGAGGVNFGDTMNITTGSTSSSVIMLSKLSNGTSYTLNGTVNGNTMTIASQTISIYSGTDTVTGTGALASPALNINYAFVSSATGTINWSFSGTKQ